MYRKVPSEHYITGNAPTFITNREMKMTNQKVDEAIDMLGDHIAGLVLNNDLHDVDGLDQIAKSALAALALVAIKLTELHAANEAKKDEPA